MSDIAPLAFTHDQAAPIDQRTIQALEFIATALASIDGRLSRIESRPPLAQSPYGSGQPPRK